MKAGSAEPRIGDFVEVRGRNWLVEGVTDRGRYLQSVNLSCIADDAQGEPLEVIWSAEIGARRLDSDGWSTLAADGTDDPTTFAAYLRTIRWSSATAAERDLFQAPFRAGIRLDAYQLLPLRKALRLPRVNLLIADDVGLGKTVEAGLILREMLLRQRIDYIVVTAPPSMTLQWQDELEAKFGLTFDIVDRERVSDLRCARGYSTNPWATGSRFIVSHRLLTDETYMAGLRDHLGAFRSRALLIVDEAHHAAPASGARYAVDSQLTRDLRELASLFEHRLFLSATPHNGHSNSFTALLEMLDPQRFTRGVEVSPRELEPVMVRRLKEDLRLIGENFPERLVEPIVIDGLDDAAPELLLARMLASYGAQRGRRLATMSRRDLVRAKLIHVGLQQRLLSSIAAFARTLEVHRRSVAAALEARPPVAAEAVAAGLVARSDDADLPLDPDEGAIDAATAAEDAVAVAAATGLGIAGAGRDDIAAELAAVDEMLAVARAAAARADARITRLVQWIDQHMDPAAGWNERRLILFTEYEDTRRWLERQLRARYADTERGDERIAVFSGVTSAERREEIKRAFNADPALEPLRILVCTDAAREGINLQLRCHDLIHVDLPWNPARLEQRNGRIDRKLQPSPTVSCRYFSYAQRPEDIVLDALVRKTERIRRQLGSVGRVIEERIAARLASDGIDRRRAAAEAAAIEAENSDEMTTRAIAELGDEVALRRNRLQREVEDLRGVLERSRERVGVDPRELKQVVAVALERAGASLRPDPGVRFGEVEAFAFDPDHPAFADDPGWRAAFDDLRTRRRRRGERPVEWRRSEPLRHVIFEPPADAAAADPGRVVQVHLEHRLIRRLLARFLSQGFQSVLERVTAVIGPGAQPRVVMLGRLVVFGPGATRLHEELIPVTAIWREADRDTRPMRALGRVGEETTLDQLADALRGDRRPPAGVFDRVRALARRDAGDLEPELNRRAAARLDEVVADLNRRGVAEGQALAELLRAQRTRISRKVEGFDDRQLTLAGVAEAEQRQARQDARRWADRLRELDRELETEPARLAAGYTVQAHRLEAVGLVYLWPVTG